MVISLIKYWLLTAILIINFYCIIFFLAAAVSNAMPWNTRHREDGKISEKMEHKPTSHKDLIPDGKKVIIMLITPSVCVDVFVCVCVCVLVCPSKLLSCTFRMLDETKCYISIYYKYNVYMCACVSICILFIRLSVCACIMHIAHTHTHTYAYIHAWPYTYLHFPV